MSPKRIAIVGSGPIGIEAALYAHTLGHDVTVFERGQIAANVAAWSHVRLFSPWRAVTTPLGRKTLESIAPPLPLEQCPTGQELRQRYLLPLAESPLLKGIVQENTQISSVKQLEGFEVLLDCAGLSHNPRFSGRDGQPAPGELALKDRIFYSIPDILGPQRELFLNHHTLLVGYNYLAAMALRDLGQLAEANPRTTVTWAIRSPAQSVHPALKDPLPGRSLLIASMLRLLESPPGWLQFFTVATIEAISSATRGFGASLRSNGRLVCLAADQIISLTGYRSPSPIADGIERASAVFTLGSKTLDPRHHLNFVLSDGHRQIQQAFASIQQDPDLSLY
jgi:threonine dehydrogenase-like Zn-dependent dehydrogenase